MDEKETGMRVAYATVSSVGQKLDVQLDRLSDCDRADRPPGQIHRPAFRRNYGIRV